jgi:hypothetical protein
MAEADAIRPLRRVAPGVWKSRDGHWTFLRAQEDPHPQRWFAYQDDDAEPMNDGSGDHALWQAVATVRSEIARRG